MLSKFVRSCWRKIVGRLGYRASGNDLYNGVSGFECEECGSTHGVAYEQYGDATECLGCGELSFPKDEDKPKEQSEISGMTFYD